MDRVGYTQPPMNECANARLFQIIDSRAVLHLI